MPHPGLCIWSLATLRSWPGSDHAPEDTDKAGIQRISRWSRLLLLNFVGGYFGLHIALNPVTALVVGFLGVPGVVLLLVLRYILRS